MNRKLLFVGFGDIATRASRDFLVDGCSVTGIARSERQVPAGVDYWRGAVADSPIQAKLRATRFDVAVVTLAPGGRTAEDYRRAYVDNSRLLTELWQQEDVRPDLVIYVSSSRVYPQSRGEWVDESSRAEPQSIAAAHLLEAEAVWRESAIDTCVLRFSGIYGPGRDHLVRQVQEGKGGPREPTVYTNRIHVDDCAGIIRHLCQRHWQGRPLDPLYLASDDEPAPSWEVRTFIAECLGLPQHHLRETPATGRSGSKRCCNRRLRDSGYEFLYPNYRSGYSALLGEC